MAPHRHSYSHFKVLFLSLQTDDYMSKRQAEPTMRMQQLSKVCAQPLCYVNMVTDETNNADVDTRILVNR